MAYTLQELTAITINNDGIYSITPDWVVASYQGNNTTYYIPVTFTDTTGAAQIKFAARGVSSSNPVRIKAVVALPNSTLDSNGWPSSYKAQGTTQDINNSSGTALTLDIVSQTTVTYWLYFRNITTVMALITPTIDFVWGDFWTYEYENLGTISSTQSKRVSPVSQKTLYCFRVRFGQGTFRIRQNSGGRSTYLYLTSSSDLDNTYDHSTGLIPSSKYDAFAMGPGDWIQYTNFQTQGFYFWIRYQDGSQTSDIQFTLEPAVIEWGIHQFNSETAISIAGESWSGNSGWVAERKVQYIPVTFSTAGSYTFTFSGNDRWYGYLTSSTSIDDNGNPNNVLNSNTSGSTSVSFSYTVQAGSLYYIMFRTRDGASNTSTFSISVSYNAPTQNWSYVSISTIPVSSALMPFSERYYITTGREGKLFTFNVSAGTATFYSSTGGIISYFGDTNNSYNPSTGQPYDYDNSSTGAFSYSCTVNSNNATYYLWVNNSTPIDFVLNITFTPAVILPSYTYTYDYHSVTFNVTNRGDYYLRYFVRLTSDTQGQNPIYDSNPYETVTTKTISLSPQTSYTINVGYSTSSSGGVNGWIGSNSFTTGSAPAPTFNNCVYIFNGSQWQKAIPYIYDGSQWREAIAYVYDGSQWKECGE